jgi:hypothetical protein
MTDLEGQFRVDFACSPQRWGMAAVCAKRTARVTLSAGLEST